MANKSQAAGLKITLIKSLIGSNSKQIANAKALGLNKIGDFIIHEDNAVLAGKVKVISHLVKVENA